MRHEIGFGKGFLDIDTEDITKYPTDDFLFMVLDRELVYAPGEQRVYSDAAYYLISRVVTKISGERLDDFLMDRLFSKIDCREVAWSKCPRKYPVGATGLYIRSDDMVKLGRIYLDGGVWKGERIVSAEWIKIVLERGYELRKFGKGFSKGGMRGQSLYVNFDENIAVAWHSFDPEGKNKLLSEIL
jgi:CubicO group peptidase (beta-lactamase class C family)